MTSNDINQKYFNKLKIVQNCNFYDAKKFIEDNPIATKTFKYFLTRDVECFNNHIFNIMIYDQTEPIGYGHLDLYNGIVWLGIAIADNMHGKHFGQFIIDILIDKALDLNLKKIRLSVDYENKKAIKLYLNNNFKYYDKNENTIFYELTLEK